MKSHDEAVKVKDQYLGKLLSLPNVVGVGVGVDEAGESCITVHVKSMDDAESIPRSLKGVKVRVQNVGEVGLL